MSMLIEGAETKPRAAIPGLCKRRCIYKLRGGFILVRIGEGIIIHVSEYLIIRDAIAV